MLVVQKLKQPILVIMALLLLFCSVGAFIYLNDQQNKKVREQQEKDANIEYNTIIVHACDIYQLADAQKLLGDQVKYEDTTVGAESSGDIDVSACSYSTPFKTVTELNSAKTSSLLVRTPKTAKGALANRDNFNNEKPADAQDILGYGNQAYWVPSKAQLKVYKDGNLIIMSAGNLRVEKRTLEETKKLADIIMPKI